MGENHFAKALHNFTMNAACADAVRHLTDKGYTLEQIRETLTFPAKSEYIAKVMWERLAETRKVLLSDAAQVLSDRTHATYHEIIETHDRYGRKSFLRVQKESPEETIFSPEDYIKRDDLWILKSAQEQVFSLSDHIPLKDRSTGSHRDT